MGLLIALASVVAYIIIGWLMLLASILVFSEEWTDELCDCRGNFDPVLVGLVIIFWLTLAIVLPVVAFGKCVGWSLRIVKTKRFSRGE